MAAGRYFSRTRRDASAVGRIHDFQGRPRKRAHPGSFEAVEANRLEAAATERLAGMASDIPAGSRHQDPRHRAVSLLDLNRSSKYSMVFFRPSSRLTRGAQSSSFFARLISGWRCSGSSGGSGRDFDPGTRPGERDDLFSQLEHGEFGRVAEVDGAREAFRTVHEANEAVDQVRHVAEGSCLLSVAEDGDRLVEQGLADEVRNDAPVMRMHAWAVSVENARHLDGHVELTVVVEEERFRATLAFVVARARANRIDVSPVILALRMDIRVAIDLAGRGLQDPGSRAAREAQHVDGAVHARFRGLHGVKLIVDRRRRACEVVDLVDFDIDRESHVVANELEARVVEQMRDVVTRTGEEIVQADDVAALFEQSIAKVRAEKSRATGYECLGIVRISGHSFLPVCAVGPWRRGFDGARP